METYWIHHVCVYIYIYIYIYIYSLFLIFLASISHQHPLIYIYIYIYIILAHIQFFLLSFLYFRFPYRIHLDTWSTQQVTVAQHMHYFLRHLIQHCSSLSIILFFIIKGFPTIVFIFIVISITFRPICTPAYFRCLSNSGTFMACVQQDTLRNSYKS